MKYLLQIFAFLLPFHAVLITYMQWKLWMDVSVIRFWKEIFIIFLLILVAIKLFEISRWDIRKIYKNNYLLWTITAFWISSFIFIFFPRFSIEIHALLWFKYDVFFLFAFIAWLYITSIKTHFETILKTIFLSTATLILIFLPWFVFWDISSKVDILWYSDEVSTYTAGSAIAFAQNVEWWTHRMQASFGDPIRYSVFLVIFYILYIGYILHVYINRPIIRNNLIIWPSIIIFISIFLAYTKTSLLGLFFGLALFIYLVRRFKYWKSITRKFMINLSLILTIPVAIVLVFKPHLFLHLSAVIARIENLQTSIEMFFYNPFWYWLWIAWPASQLWTDIVRVWWWEVGVSWNAPILFLPENWYVQILLEQWLIWLSLFIWVLSVIWVYLYRIVKHKKDYMSIAMFTAFITILFMWNFTHVFEEAATSYLLFMLLWAYISTHYRHWWVWDFKNKIWK